MTVYPQLPLALALKDSATFDSFVAGANVQALTHLQRLVGDPWQPGTYLWGVAGVGKSHLLQAVCHAAGEKRRAAAYLPLQASERIPPQALDGMETLDVICIDDIQAIAAQPDWAVALLHLFERVRAGDCAIVITGNALPAELGLEFPQLSSRLAEGWTFHLQPLADADIEQALQLRAARRGLTLPEATSRYLIRRCKRDMHCLVAALDRLDRASLAAQRKLSATFARHVLDQTDPP